MNTLNERRAPLRSPLFWMSCLAGLAAFVLYSKSLSSYFRQDDFYLGALVDFQGRIEWPKVWEMILPKGVESIFPRIRPVTGLGLIVDYFFWGVRPFGYHFSCLLIHILAVLTFLAFVRMTWRDRNPLFWLLIPLFLALYPGTVEAVAVSSSRGPLYCGFFMILSLFFYACARRKKGKGGRISLFALSFLSFLMALGSYEPSISLPFIVLLYELVLVRREKWWKIPRSLWVPLAVYFILLCLYFGLRYWMFGSFTGRISLLDEEKAELGAGQLRSFMRNFFPSLFKMMVPINEEVVHSSWKLHLLSVPLLAFPLLLIAWRRIRGGRILTRHFLMGLLWCAVSIAPMISVFTIRPNLSGGRYLYPVAFPFAFLMGEILFGPPSLERRGLWAGRIGAFLVLGIYVLFSARNLEPIVSAGDIVRRIQQEIRREVLRHPPETRIVCVHLPLKHQGVPVSGSGLHLAVQPPFIPEVISLEQINRGSHKILQQKVRGAKQFACFWWNGDEERLEPCDVTREDLLQRVKFRRPQEGEVLEKLTANTPFVIAYAGRMDTFEFVFVIKEEISGGGEAGGTAGESQRISFRISRNRLKALKAKDTTLYIWRPGQGKGDFPTGKLDSMRGKTVTWFVKLLARAGEDFFPVSQSGPRTFRVRK